MKFVKSLVCAAAAVACLPSAFANVLAKAKDSIKFEHNVGLYSGQYWAPSMGGQQLTKLVGQLLDTATANLAKP